MYMMQYAMITPSKIPKYVVYKGYTVEILVSKMDGGHQHKFIIWILHSASTVSIDLDFGSEESTCP